MVEGVVSISLVGIEGAGPTEPFGYSRHRCKKTKKSSLIFSPSSSRTGSGRVTRLGMELLAPLGIAAALGRSSPNGPASLCGREAL